MKQAKEPKQRKDRVFTSDWEAELYGIRKRERWFRRIMIGVACLVVAGAIYMMVLVMKQDDPPPRATGGGLQGTGANRGGFEEAPDPAPKIKASVHVPSDFAEGVVNEALGALQLGDEANLQALVDHYARDLVGDRAAVAVLQAVLRHLREGTPALALEDLESIDLGERISSGVRAVVLSRLERDEEAGLAFKQAEESVQPPPFYFESAVFLLRRRDLAGAYAQLEVAARMDSQTVRFHRGLANLAFALQNWEKVIAHVDRGVSLRTTPAAELSVLAAVAETQIGKHSEAAVRCQKLLEAHPDCAEAKALLAMLLDPGG